MTDVRTDASTQAREQILAKVRAALRDVPDAPAEQDTPVPWEYGQVRSMEDLLDRFIDRIIDYKAQLVRVGPDEVATAVLDALKAHGVGSVVLPTGVPGQWREAIEGYGIRVVSDEPQLSNAELNEVESVVTAAAVAGAETGTIVLDHGPDQGRRALSLVPDVHVCVVRADQVVTDVPEMVPRLQDAIHSGRPLTWISGGSATSDIELNRVEGVHGPRHLYVVLAEG
ncbi:MAG: LUD domain-containing protein [Austwickia sp.]|nr:LUD domain-containing protein [Austwickia sp.]